MRVLANALSSSVPLEGFLFSLTSFEVDRQ